MKIKKEVKIGVFGLLMLFLLYWGVNFLKGKDLFSSNWTFYAYYESVDGIQVTSPIIIRGISVGSVTKISFKPEMNNKVELQLSVKKEYSIPENTIARIASNGIIGDKAIFLELGSSPKLLEDNGVITAETERSILAVAGGEFDYFKQKIDDLLRSLDKTLQGVNAILGEDGGSIKGSLDNIESITAQLDRTVKDKADSIGLVIDNLTAFSTMLASNSSRITNIMSDLEEFSGSLSETDVAGMVSSLNIAVDNINRAVSSSDGSLGLLLNDRALYDSLTVASANLSSLLADLEQNPGRYVHFSLFGRKNK